MGARNKILPPFVKAVTDEASALSATELLVEKVTLHNHDGASPNGNAATVFFGDPAVTTATGGILDAGAAFTIVASTGKHINLATIFVVAVAAGPQSIRVTPFK